ncbi:MAG: hypothetical protein RJB11_1559, partial [Planctomycetota bacterium]
MTLNPNSAWRSMSRRLACSGLFLLILFAINTPNCIGFQGNSLARLASSPWGIESLIYETTESGNQPHKALGAPSCSASACHGGPAAGVSSTEAIRGSEYPLWLESDPHARSWRTLNSEKSVDILQRLRILVDGAIVNKPAYQNCLACHNTTKELQVDGISPRLAEGVGCESCHGPSERWRDSHYQGSFSVSESIATRGLVNSKSELVRAKTCTLCHVGGP